MLYYDSLLTGNTYTLTLLHILNTYKSILFCVLYLYFDILSINSIYFDNTFQQKFNNKMAKWLLIAIWICASVSLVMPTTSTTVNRARRNVHVNEHWDGFKWFGQAVYDVGSELINRPSALSGITNLLSQGLKNGVPEFSIGSAIQNVHRQISKGASAVDNVLHQMGHKINKGATAVESVLNEMGHEFDKGANTLENVAVDVGHEVEKAAVDVGHEVEKQSKALETSVNKFGHTVSRTVSDIAEQTIDATTNTFTKVLQSIKQFLTKYLLWICAFIFLMFISICGIGTIYIKYCILPF